MIGSWPFACPLAQWRRTPSRNTARPCPISIPLRNVVFAGKLLSQHTSACFPCPRTESVEAQASQAPGADLFSGGIFRRSKGSKPFPSLSTSRRQAQGCALNLYGGTGNCTAEPIMQACARTRTEALLRTLYPTSSSRRIRQSLPAVPHLAFRGGQPASLLQVLTRTKRLQLSGLSIPPSVVEP
jgi:hypothetical protein